MNHGTNSTFQNISDQVLFSEAARRLKAGFKSRYKTDCRHGSFNFVIHNGRFLGIEENIKNRWFWGQLNLASPHQQGKKHE